MLKNDQKYLRARVDKVQEMLEEEETPDQVKGEIIFKNAREKILKIYENLQRSYNMDNSYLLEKNKLQLKEISVLTDDQIDNLTLVAKEIMDLPEKAKNLYCERLAVEKEK